MAKEFYRGNLPHWQPPNSVFALTYNLEGSLPKHIVHELREARKVEIEKIKTKELTEETLQKELKNIHSLYFGKYDNLLDNPQNDIQYLKNPLVAKIVMDSLEYLNNTVWKMVCYCMMSNHVHLIVYKLKQPLFEIMQSHKSFTAQKANKVLNKKGQFWQRETFDRKIRDRVEFATQVKYALFNPVKAGLVKDWRNWKYSWIREEFKHYAP